jgi:hypothetical protein
MSANLANREMAFEQRMRPGPEAERAAFRRLARRAASLGPLAPAGVWTIRGTRQVSETCAWTAYVPAKTGSGEQPAQACPFASRFVCTTEKISGDETRGKWTCEGTPPAPTPSQTILKCPNSSDRGAVARGRRMGPLPRSDPYPPVRTAGRRSGSLRSPSPTHGYCLRPLRGRLPAANPSLLWY